VQAYLQSFLMQPLAGVPLEPPDDYQALLFLKSHKYSNDVIKNIVRINLKFS
jgi:hypothetical protein